MAITIRELIAVSSLDLRLIYNGDHDALESGIVWVHPTDVVNAAQFAEPGEILLTCSTNFPLESMANTNDLSLLKRDRKKLGLSSAFENTDEAYQELWMSYVRSLSGAGVTAIGFGVQMKHPTIPQALIEAVKAYDVVLFEVPKEINFSSITKTVIQHQAEQNEDVQRIMYSAQRELFRAASGDDPVHDILSQTASLSGGWSAFIDDHMNVLAITDKRMHDKALTIARRLARRKAQSPRESGSIFGNAAKHGQYCASTIRTDTQGHGIIIVSSSQTGVLGSVVRSLCAAAADALSLSLSRKLDSLKHEGALHTIALDELASGNITSATLLIRALWRVEPTFPATLCCMEYPKGMSTEELTFLFETANIPDTICGDLYGMLWILSDVEHDRDVEQWAAQWKTEYGLVDVSSWTDMPRGFKEAVRNLHLKDAIISGSLNELAPLELMNPDLAQLYAEELMSPLNVLSPHERFTLMTTMREMMSHAFSVGATSAALHIHRHTVENRMNKLERMLGLDFNDEADRVKLWIASSFIRGMQIQ